MKRRISVHDVKQALLDERFRSTLPESLKPDVDKFLSNPGCACNHPIYQKVMQEATEQLAAYYPTKEPADPQAAMQVSKNEWTVINCSIHELADKLRQLGPGRKQLDVARFQDQVTVVVNELDIF
jgi:hypothetical protein